MKMQIVICVLFSKFQQILVQKYFYKTNRVGNFELNYLSSQVQQPRPYNYSFIFHFFFIIILILKLIMHVIKIANMLYKLEDIF